MASLLVIVRWDGERARGSIGDAGLVTPIEYQSAQHALDWREHQCGFAEPKPVLFVIITCTGIGREQRARGRNRRVPRRASGRESVSSGNDEDVCKMSAVAVVKGAVFAFTLLLFNDARRGGLPTSMAIYARDLRRCDLLALAIFAGAADRATTALEVDLPHGAFSSVSCIPSWLRHQTHHHMVKHSPRLDGTFLTPLRGVLTYTKLFVSRVGVSRSV